MCGPADFVALQTCISRVAGLCVVGVTSYAVYKAVALYRDRPLNRTGQQETATGNPPNRLALQGSGERSDS